MTRSFNRTVDGFTNYPAFLRAQRIIFCEGKCEAASLTDSEETPDVIYWRFRLNTDERATLHSLGGKKQVASALRAGLDSGAAEAYYACFDRDYDDVENSPLYEGIRNRIFFTKGYSVENDLICEVPSEKIIQSFLPRAKKSALVQFAQALSCLERKLRRLAEIDVKMRGRGKSFLPTKSSVGFVEFIWADGTLFPKIDTAQCRKMRLKKLQDFTSNHTQTVRNETNRESATIIRRHDSTLRSFLSLPGGFVLHTLRKFVNDLLKNFNGASAISERHFFDAIIRIFQTETNPHQLAN